MRGGAGDVGVLRQGQRRPMRGVPGSKGAQQGVLLLGGMVQGEQEWPSAACCAKADHGGSKGRWGSHGAQLQGIPCAAAHATISKDGCHQRLGTQVVRRRGGCGLGSKGAASRLHGVQAVGCCAGAAGKVDALGYVTQGARPLLLLHTLLLLSVGSC